MSIFAPAATAWNAVQLIPFRTVHAALFWRGCLDVRAAGESMAYGNSVR